MIFEIEILNGYESLWPASRQIKNVTFCSSRKYVLDVHCSVRIRIFDKMTLNQKPLFYVFLGEAIAPIPVSAPIARHTTLAGTLVHRYIEVL